MRKFRKIVAAAMASLALVITTQAQAVVVCTFTVSSLTLQPSGTVGANFSGAAGTYFWALCSVTGTIQVSSGWGNEPLTSDVCKTLYSKLLTARASNKPVTLWFQTAATTCTAGNIPASGWPSLFPYVIEF